MSEFAAGIVGALVGGLASLLGSIYGQQRQLVREARFRIYDEHLPAIERYWDAASKHKLTEDATDGADRAVSAIGRLASVTGSAERRHAFALYEAWTNRRNLEQGIYPIRPGEDIYIPDEDEKRRRLRDYDGDILREFNAVRSRIMRKLP